MVLMNSEPLSERWKAVDFSLPSTDGGTVSLANFSDKRGLVVVFTCNHCPYAQASWKPLSDICAKYSDSIGFVAINSNDDALYPQDSFAAMQNEVTERSIPFPYVRDETQEVARAYHAQCTPDVYLFVREDDAFSLYYHGRINDNWKNYSAVTEHTLSNAITDLLSGKRPPATQPPSLGCSIKWRETA